MRHGAARNLRRREAAAQHYRPTGNGPPLTAWSHGLRKWFVHLGRKAEFSYWQCYGGASRHGRQNGPIAQLDRVADFYSAGCRFESCWDRHCSKNLVLRDQLAQTPRRPEARWRPARLPVDISHLGPERNLDRTRSVGILSAPHRGRRGRTCLCPRRHLGEAQGGFERVGDILQPQGSTKNQTQAALIGPVREHTTTNLRPVIF
jgi:hypothetical protein